MAKIEEYSFGKSFTVSERVCVASVGPEHLDMVKEIIEKAYDKAAEYVEEQLYHRGFMTCNAHLESIEDMRKHGNYLVQADIEELDKKYKEN